MAFVNDYVFIYVFNYLIYYALRNNLVVSYIIAL